MSKKKRSRRNSHNLNYPWSRFRADQTRRAGGQRLYREVIEDNIVNLTVPAPCTLQTVVEQIASRSHLVIPIDRLSSRLSETTLIRGKTVFGLPGKYFDQMAAQQDLQWWISDKGLNIEVCAGTLPKLAPFDHLAGSLMFRAKRAKNRRVVPSEYKKIAAALDEDGYKPLHYLERRGRQCLGNWNQKHPRKAIHSFLQAIEARNPPCLRRAVLRRLYRARETWTKFHRE